jgi:hypothetical protein
MMMFHSKVLVKRRQELPTRLKNIPPSSEFLERRYKQSNQATIDSSKALLKAQLKAGHHTLTKESLMAVIKKYGWQYCLQPTLF